MTRRGHLGKGSRNTDVFYEHLNKPVNNCDLIPHRIKRLKEKYKLSSAMLARLACVAPLTVENIVNRGKTPSLPVLCRIANVFGVDIGWFTLADEFEKPPNARPPQAKPASRERNPACLSPPAITSTPDCPPLKT